MGEVIGLFQDKICHWNCSRTALRSLGKALRRYAMIDHRLPQSDRGTPSGHSRAEDHERTHQVMLENAAVGLWMAFLIGVGCWTLNVVAKRVQGNECLAGGSRCAMHDQQIMLSQAQQNESGWIGEYLKRDLGETRSLWRAMWTVAAVPHANATLWDLRINGRSAEAVGQSTFDCQA